MTRPVVAPEVWVELMNLFAICAAAGDAHDTDAYVDCFVEDAVLSHRGEVTLEASWGDQRLGHTVGRDAIRLFREAVPTTPVRRHSLSNLRVVALEGDALVCEQLVTVIGIEEGASPRIMRLATYEDRVTRGTDGHLRISERTITFAVPAKEGDTA
jgi:SnoaL-like domain